MKIKRPEAAAATIIEYSRGNSKEDNHPTRHTAKNFAAFVDAIDADRADSKDGAPYICAAFNGDARRCAEGVEPVRFLAVDVDRIDAEKLPALKARFANVSHASWRTHSSTRRAPRRRFLIELSRAATRDECIAIGKALKIELVKELGDAIEVDDSTFKPEQPSFVPPTKSNVLRVVGEPLDVEQGLKAAAKLARDTSTSEPTSEADLLERIRNGERLHDALLVFVAKMVGKGLTRETIQAAALGLIERARRARGNRVDEIADEELDRMIDGALRKYSPPQQQHQHGRKLLRFRGSDTAGYDLGATATSAAPIDCTPGNRATVVDRAMQIAASHPAIYQRGGALVRVVRADKLDDDNRLRRDAERLLIAPCPQEWVTTELARRARFCRMQKDGAKAVDPPGWLAPALIADGVFDGVRSLQGITSSPVLRADGSVWATPGYDAQTGMLLAARGDLPTIPDAPTKADAHAALERLRVVFSKYTWADEFSESVALSLILTKVARHRMPTAPFFLITSPTAGSGKTYIVEVASIIADGVNASMCAWPGDDDEMRKTITSALLAGENFVAFDNVANGKTLRSPTLDKTLTSPVVADRMLGKTQRLILPNNAVWCATGNNIQPCADMVRRTIVARVDPCVERPWDRKFPWTPDAYARQHRGELLAAALTILSAHLRTSSAPLSAPMQSFDDWSRIVRDALIWLGLPDPVRSQDLLADEDPDAEQRAELLGALHEAFGSARSFTADEVAKVARRGSAPEPAEAERHLADALHGRVVGKQMTAHGVGYVLRGMKGQITRGKVLRGHPDRRTGSARWRIEILR